MTMQRKRKIGDIVDETINQGNKIFREDTSLCNLETVTRSSTTASTSAAATASCSTDSSIKPVIVTAPDNSPSADLWGLLDFSELNSEKDILARFDAIANALLCDYQLVVTRGVLQTAFEIIELEFYLQKSACHEDPFTHAHEEQSHSGKWYFHRVPRRFAESPSKATSAAGYRGGTRKGLDLTLGGPVTSPFFTSSTSGSSTSILRGGALLRTLRRICDGKIISGPSLLVDEILRLSNAASIQELVTQEWNGDIRGFPPPGSPADTCHSSLYLQTKDKGVPSSTKPHIYRSPRIGLDLSNPETTDSRSPLHPRVMFVAKPYRYFTNPHLLTANGRGQTYVGVYRECLQSRFLTDDDDDDDVSTKELCRILGMKEQVVKRYLTDYKLGYDKGSLRSFIGPAGKGASASLSTYLKMMGTLQRVFDEAMLPQFTTTKGEEEEGE